MPIEGCPYPRPMTVAGKQVVLRVRLSTGSEVPLSGAGPQEYQVQGEVGSRGGAEQGRPLSWGF